MAQTVELKVAMMCNGCVGAVERVLKKLEGVDNYDISLEKQKVTVTTSKLEPQKVFDAVSKTGKATSYWTKENENGTKDSKEETNSKV